MMDGTHLGCIWDCDPYGWQPRSVKPVKLVSYTSITDTVWAQFDSFLMLFGTGCWDRAAAFSLRVHCFPFRCRYGRSGGWGSVWEFQNINGRWGFPPSILSLSLSQPQPLYMRLSRWTQETSGTLLICCSAWLQRYKRHNINIHDLICLEYSRLQVFPQPVCFC